MFSPKSFLVTNTLLLSALPSFAGDRWCGDRTYPCPVESYGWTLFVDTNQGTPDFWWGPPVPVREIFVCEHGVQFLFTTVQRGESQHTALVFPTPTRALLAHRLDIQDETLLESEFQHFRQRFDSLTESLASISGGALASGTRFSFDPSEGKGSATLITGKLALAWRGTELLLRGYLDVYFAPIEKVQPRRRAPPASLRTRGARTERRVRSASAPAEASVEERGEPTDPAVRVALR